jgi:hypothetical protein
MAAAAGGVEYPALINGIVEHALKRYEQGPQSTRKGRKRKKQPAAVRQ